MEWKWIGRKLPVWNMEKSSSITYHVLFKAGNFSKQIGKLFAKSSQYNSELIADLSLTNNSSLFFNEGLEKSFMQQLTT